MALKNTKIVRELAQTCNKFLSSRPEISSPHRAPERPESVRENRHYATNAAKSPLIPKADFTREPEQTILFEMNHLQPATYPKHITVNTNPRDEDVWQLHRTSDSRTNIKYPSDMVAAQPKSSLVTKTFKKNVLRGPMNIVGTRNYTTSPFLFVSRHYSKRGKPEDKCDKPKKKKCPEGVCPHINIGKNCKQSTGSHCEHYYVDPKCTKKMAPYPSYSETCPQDLEDSPSECFQCPWNKCGGVESIKPPKRKYHTSIRTNVPALMPGNFMVDQDCDARKVLLHKPCQAPPPKCGEEKKKKKGDNCPGNSPKDKKRKCASGWTHAYALWRSKETIIPVGAAWDAPLEMKETEMDKDKDVRCKFPFDKRQADYEYVKQKPCAEDRSCKKKKVKRVPDGCDPDPPKVCMPNVEDIALYLKKCPKDRPKCPVKEKPSCPFVDKSINVTSVLAREHDKGHPPPCEEKKKESEKCPKKKPKEPYKVQRDLYEPYYRKNPRPYPPHSEH